MPAGKEEIGHDLIVVGGIVMVSSAGFPDSEPGSFRSIVVAVAGVLIAIGSYLARPPRTP